MHQDIHLQLLVLANIPQNEQEVKVGAAQACRSVNRKVKETICISVNGWSQSRFAWCGCKYLYQIKSESQHLHLLFQIQCAGVQNVSLYLISQYRVVQMLIFSIQYICSNNSLGSIGHKCWSNQCQFHLPKAVCLLYVLKTIVYLFSKGHKCVTVHLWVWLYVWKSVCLHVYQCLLSFQSGQ